MGVYMVVMSCEVMRIIKDKKGRSLRAFYWLAYSAACCLRGSPLVVMSCEVMRIIKHEKSRACSRFTRSPTRRLVISGVPLCVAVLCCVFKKK